MNDTIKSTDSKAVEGEYLIPEIPVSSGEGGGDDDYALLTKCSTEIEADMIAANLEGAGIESYILRQNDSSFPVVGNLSVVKIYVRLAQLTDAQEYLSNFFAQDEDEDERV
ncbi:MAG: DUF2007 domain-containing protein [Ignavibacteriaceae bacterium]|nr:DUF2007 domain-containing protein [Ignavibacteriaceae bacterium]